MKRLGDVLVFALAAVLVYLLGWVLFAAWPMWSAMWTMMGFGWSPLLFVLVLLVVLLVFGVWTTTGRDSAPAGSHRPEEEGLLEILRRRYAAGEITREEYQQMRYDLMRGE
ncbi:MAG: SHOCT domain-containing protein [Chloroflexota bacterium]|nr:SHOCT domain-containing protein [Chloroflexota bacterium]